MFKKLFGFGNKDKNKDNSQIEKEEISIEEVDDLDIDVVSEDEILKELGDLSNDETMQVEEVPSEEKTEEVVVEVEKNADINLNNTVVETPNFEENIVEETEKIIEEKPVEKKGFFAKIREGLAKTKETFTDQFNTLFNLHTKIDDDFLDELEETLVLADIGVELTMDIIDHIKEEVKKNKIEDTNVIKDIIKNYLVDMLESTKGVEDVEGKQKLIMIVGVNGVGKTTSIGKLSYRIKSSGKSVIVAAADTFRAAAVEQLQEWCNRSGVDIVASEQGSDPGSIVYDAIQSARAKKTDVLICDTAGRLHNKVNLMNELSKIFKIIEKEYSFATREVLLVIDANTGQNGLIQAKLFKESCNIDGIILTKLDSTAKGGIVFPIVKELNVPIKYVGVGEKIDDLQEFNAKMFVDAIFE